MTDILTVSLQSSLEGSVAASWDEACRQLGVSPFQDRIGAAVRAECLGHRLVYALGHRGRDLVFGAAITVRHRWPLPDRLTVTRGPWAADESTLLEGTERLLDAWQRQVRVPLLLHVDPHWADAAGSLRQGLQNLGFTEAPVADFHPRTVQVNLARPLADIRAGYRELTRRMLKKAEREGITSRFGTAADVAIYDRLHSAAAAEKRYGLPHEDWMRRAMTVDRAVLVLTNLDNETIGGAFVLRGPASLYYMYGATKPNYRGPGSYHAMWHLMQWAHGVGITHFDLGAVPEEHEGIAFFKRGFGGDEIVAMPEMERPFRPLAYRLWTTARSWRHSG